MAVAELVVAPDGVPVAFEARGSGAPALVFVHGWACDRGYWSAQLDHFAARHLVVALDLAGHGASGSGRAGWTMAAFAQDVVAVADALGLDRIVLVGHSMGGDVVVAAAPLLGARLDGIVWVDAYRTLGTPRSQAQIDAELAPLRADFAAAARDVVTRMFGASADPALVDRVASHMSAAPPGIAVEVLRHAIGFEPDLLGTLPRIAAPVVAINPAGPGNDADALRRHGVELVTVPGVGHFAMLEDPDGFNHALAGAIDRIAVARPA